jgi:hypothetical protein
MSLVDLLPLPVRIGVRRLRDTVSARLLARVAMRRLAASTTDQRPHGLKHPLIITLTSYPARFSTLHLTLACLLTQSVRADKIVLWLAHQDMESLPSKVLALAERGIEIRACEDLRSFKKLVPALGAFPDGFLVTADDDLFYPKNWLETLTDAVRSGEKAILCHRAHRIRRCVEGEIMPYLQWQRDVLDSAASEATFDLVATTGAGAIFPPGSLAPIVIDRAKFEKLCPDSDDLWFHWSARLAGTPTRKVGPRLRLYGWQGTQEQSLWTSNLKGGNDAAVAALGHEFSKMLPSALPR